MTEKSDAEARQMSKALKAKMMEHVATLGGNALAICDCKAVTFYVAMKSDPNGNNFILALICPGCKKTLRVPFNSMADEVGDVAGSA